MTASRRSTAQRHQLRKQWNTQFQASAAPMRIGPPSKASPRSTLQTAFNAHARPLSPLPGRPLACWSHVRTRRPWVLFVLPMVLAARRPGGDPRVLGHPHVVRLESLINVLYMSARPMAKSDECTALYARGFISHLHMSFYLYAAPWPRLVQHQGSIVGRLASLSSSARFLL